MITQALYEQPLNETVRACLRLETLFKKIHLRQKNKEVDRLLPLMIDIIGVLDRPDLKNKLSAMLHSQQRKLEQLITHPAIDHAALACTLDEASDLTDRLHTQHHLANELMEHPFLKIIRQQMASPGGLMPCNAPPYLLWSKQTLADRIAQSTEWTMQLATLEKSVAFILHLIRSSQSWQKKHTESGFYQQKLNSTNEVQLIRLKVPEQILPEISAGAHLLVVHFTAPQFLDGDYQLAPATHVPFMLACCSEIF